MKFFKNIWNLLPAFIGTVELILPLVKEILVDVVRIIAILPLLWSVDEPIIKKINEIYDVIYGWVEKIKSALILR
jgi:hypothetical protein